MKNKSIFLTIAAVFALASAAIFLLSMLKHGQENKAVALITDEPSLKQESVNVQHESRTGKIEGVNVQATPETSQKKDVVNTAADTAQKEVAQDQKKVRKIDLKTSPEAMRIVIPEGKRDKTTFELTNTGVEDVTAMLFKSKLNNTPEESAENLKDLVLNPRFFSGIPWLMLYPHQLDIAQGVTKSVEVIVDTRDQTAGSYHADIFVVIANTKQNLIIPVYIEITSAPKLKISKIVIDDGMTRHTRGNANKVANPGELVEATVCISNTGAAEAEDVTMEIKPNESSAKVIGVPLVSLPDIGAGGEVQAHFIIEVAADAHPVIPPTITLTLRDKQGTQWEENIYLGDADAIAYPTGLMKKDKK